VIFLNLMLAWIPTRKREHAIPKVFKLLVARVALPIYVLLISILYVYLAKIIVTWSFPSGQVNWFASVASLLFIFFWLALAHYDDDRLIRPFIKYGGLVFIPIIVVQFIAIWIRLSNYGLTSLRYVSVVLNILALVFAVVSVIDRGRFVKYLLLVVAGVALVLTMTPLNLFDVPIWEQTHRLTRVLERNAMWVEGRIVVNENISDEDKIKITSAYEFLQWNETSTGKTPRIVRDIPESESSFKETFGFDKKYEERSSDKWYGAGDSWEDEYDGTEWVNYYHEINSIEVDGYRNLTVVNYYSFEEDTKTSFDIKDKAAALYEEHGSDANDIEMKFEIAEGLLILESLGFQVEADGSIVIESYRGYLLTR